MEKEIQQQEKKYILKHSSSKVHHCKNGNRQPGIFITGQQECKKVQKNSRIQAKGKGEKCGVNDFQRSFTGKKKERKKKSRE